MPQPRRDIFADHLQKLPYFAGVDPDALHSLVALASWHEYATGAIVFLEGELNRGLYCIESGWIKVIKMSPEGREQVLSYVGPGDLFAEFGMFLARPNPATALALEPCALWLLRRDDLQPLLAHRSDVLLQVMANMADRITFLAGLVADVSLHPVEVRLARLLLSEASSGALVRQPWLTQAELAARLGTVPDVLNRALHALADAGTIRVDRRQIAILDRSGLARRAMLEDPQ